MYFGTSYQLPFDCLIEVLKSLEDKATLHSCLLLNRLWCQATIRILWQEVQNYNTLIACLPNESKTILHTNKIIIPTPTPNPLLFDYVAFVKVLSVNEFHREINRMIVASTGSPKHDNYKNTIVIRETLKMLMNRTSLRGLNFEDLDGSNRFSDFPFITYPGATDFLKNLSELSCNSNMGPKFFRRISQSCHHLQSLQLTIRGFISGGLSDFISTQQDLKDLSLLNGLNGEDSSKIIPSITTLSDHLVKLSIYEGSYHNVPLSFVAKLTNLQELLLSVRCDYSLDKDFRTLQHVTFPQLRVLKFYEKTPDHEYLIKFLEHNGRNLRVIHFNQGGNSLNSAISKFCPKLRSLYTRFKSGEVEALKIILLSCPQLKSMKVCCGGYYLTIRKLLETVVKYSPETLDELKILLPSFVQPVTFPEESVPFFVSWNNSIPRKFLSLIIIDSHNRLKFKGKSAKVVKDFKELGVIGKFEIVKYDS